MMRSGRIDSLARQLLLVGWLTAWAFPAWTQHVTASGNTTKAWTYWWWMGSAVNEADITAQLTQFARAGLGGVHIIPIYGVKGYETRFIPFLSDRWLAVFAHTVREGNRLGLGVDLTTGTGWPFGGPGVIDSLAANAWTLDGQMLTAVPTKQQVKRAAPGGQGPVIDYFSATAVRSYLRRFDSTLTRLPERPRAIYNDSYEVYGANWTTRFLHEFQRRRGYDLRSQLPAFLDTNQTAKSVLVHQDYHQTLSELLHDGLADTWGSWAAQQGYRTRNQAHGSPGNLIDLYARADIPETESFGSSRFPIPGLRVDANYEVDRFGTPNPLAMKFASSAAHLLGKQLVSSETGTWLANHFQVSLSQIKPQVDELFASGINHVFYHGIPYSPPAVGWPGWQFYASTNYGPTSHFWPHLPLLNNYIERCQSRLQTSLPDNDVLVYFPIHDLWATPARSAGGIHQLEVHHVERWLLKQRVGQLCTQLQERGFGFDYVSDSLLNQLTVRNKLLQSPGGSRYTVLLVPKTTYIPEATMRQLAKLARQGVHIVFDSTLPEQAAGFYQHESRSKTIRRLGKAMRRLPNVTVSPDPFMALTKAGAKPESWAGKGLSFIRKRHGDITQYFVTNLGANPQRGWITLSVVGKTLRYDPLTAKTEPLPMQKNALGRWAVWLVLEPGQSCFLNVLPASPDGSIPADTTKKTPVLLTNPWTIRALSGGRPALAFSRSVPAPISWTTLGDSTGYFWGTMQYSTTFTLPGFPTKTGYTLRLGDVREVADVRVNGQPVATAWCLPFQVNLPADVLKTGENTLEINVTNLSANYMRLYDRLHPDWKKFYDINIVDIRYRPFDATQWPAQPSGLLGPVSLISH